MTDEVREGPTLSQLGTRARKAAVWALLDKWVTRSVTTVVFIILARLLTPYEFGIVALALVVRSFVGVFVDQGFNEAIVQTPRLGRRYANTAFWTAIATGSLLTLAMIGLAPFVARSVLGNASVAPLLRVLAISLTLTALGSTQSALLQRDLAFRELAIRRVAAQLIAGVAAVVAAFLGAGAWSIVLQTILQGAIGAAILWRLSGWRPALEFHTATFRSLFGFGVSMLGIDLLYAVQQQGDNFVVGRWLGVSALGIYALAFRFYYVIVDITMSSMGAVALATFSRLQQDLSGIRRVFLSATRLTAIVTLPLFAGMAVVATELIPVLVGERWDPAVPVLRALCPSGLILCLTYLDRSLIIALGRPRLALGVFAAGVALRLLGYAVGVQFGVVGVAVALSLTSIIFWPGRLLVLRRLTRVSLGRYARQLSSAAAGTGVMVLALLVVRSILLGHVGPFGLLAVEVLVGAAVYCTFLAVSDRASVHELIGLVRPVLSGERSSER